MDSIISRRARFPLSSLVSGFLLAMAFPNPHLFFLAWVGLIPLFFFCLQSNRELGKKRHTAIFPPFFISGLLFHLIVLRWLAVNTYWAGGWALAGWIALCVYLSFYWGIFAVIWNKMRYHLKPRWWAISAGVLWAAMESLQGKLLTGFGWCSLGYSQGPDRLFMQLASVGGIPLLSAILVIVSVLGAQALKLPAKRLLWFLLALFLTGAVHIAGFFLLPSTPLPVAPYRVGIIQPCFSQEVKWDPAFRGSMYKIMEQLTVDLVIAQQKPLDLILWPEAQLVAPVDDEQIAHILQQIGTKTNTPLLTGGVRSLPHGQWTNSSFLISPDGQIKGYYDKIHLAPFGEYVPLGNIFPALRKILPALGEMTPGGNPVLLQAGKKKVGPLICFEVLFPSMSQQLRSRGADMLVVLTNLGWFGSSCALEQEREIARARSIETRLPLIQCANTGYSGLFTPDGLFHSISSRQIRAAAVLEIPQPSSKPPAFLLIPDWFFILLALILYTTTILFAWHGRKI